MARYVTLGDGRKISLGRYVAAWKACKTLSPDTAIGRGVSGTGETASEALRRLHAGMHDRINRHIPGYGIGRKWSDDWFWPTWRASRDLNSRVVIRWLPSDLKSRFAHRLEQGV